MADNLTLNRGSGGKKLKTQEIDSAHYPVMKLADGTANSDTVIESGNGLSANALRVTLASNSQGQLILLDGDEAIGEVSIGGAGWDSGDLAKRFNEAAQSGDVSVAGLVRRTDTPANQSGTDGDYEWPQVSDGRAWASLIGDAAHDAAVTGKPVLLGFEGRSVDSTDSGETAEGDVTRLKGDRAGRAFVTTAHPRGFHSSVDYGASAQTNATVQAAPGAGLSLFITDITIRNGPTLANNVTLLNGSGGSIAFECYLGVNQGLTTNLRQPIQLDANTLLAVTSSANSELSITVDGYIAAAGDFVFSEEYDPGMMTFDGSTGYYSDTYTSSGNKVTVVARFNRATFAGGTRERLCQFNAGGTARAALMIHSSDHATASRQNKLVFFSQNSAGTTIVALYSSSDLNDGQDHVVFCEFDADAGTAVFRVDGADEDDTGNAERIAPTTGTLATGSSSATVGAASGPSEFFGGDIGYFGMRDIGGLDFNDFMTGSTPKELDESGWTEWGAQPLYWNEFGEMDDNKGSAGNMTENGTITGPA